MKNATVLTARRASRSPCILAAFVVAACGSSSREDVHVQRTDSAGISIVHYDGEDRPLDWRFERIATIAPDPGGPAGEFDVADRSVAADDAGRIYVMEWRAQRALVFDSDYTFLHAVGRKGGGPGELEFPLAFAVQPDGTLGIYDAGKGRLVRFAPDGSALEEIGMGTGFYGGTLAMLDDGSVVFDAQLVIDPANLAREVRHTAGTNTSILARRSGPTHGAIRLESCGMGFTSLPEIFAPEFRIAVHGHETALVADETYDLQVFDGTSHVRSIRRGLTPQPATAELARRELGDGMRIRIPGGERVCDPAEVVARRGYAKAIPTISRVAIAPTGEYWVQRGGIKDEPQPIDVFGADGTYLGTLPATGTFPAAFLPGDRVAVVEKNELDVGRVEIYQVRRAPSA
jgi:hypothetical protein